jgi:hypothetical protein
VEIKENENDIKNNDLSAENQKLLEELTLQETEQERKLKVQEEGNAMFRRLSRLMSTQNWVDIA